MAGQQRTEELTLKPLRSNAGRVRAGATLAERLAARVVDAGRRGVPAAVAHEAKRLLLNSVKAAAEAAMLPGAAALERWAIGAAARSAAQRPGFDASVLWLGASASPARAAAANAALCRWLDLADTHLPTLLCPGAAVVPAVLAYAEAEGHDGRRLLAAIAIAVAAELAAASELGLTAEGDGERGEIDDACSDGAATAIGAAAGCAALAGLPEEATAIALALAQIGAPAAGRPAPSSADTAFGAAMAVQAGCDAFELARQGWAHPPAHRDGQQRHRDAPLSPARARTARAEASFDLAAIRQLSLHARPAEGWLQAPLEALLALRAAVPGDAAGLRIELAPRAWRLANAAADVAAHDRLALAWQAGRFSVDERADARAQRAAARLLATPIELVADQRFDNLDSAAAVIEADASGSPARRIVVDHFLGAAGRPLSDSQLAELFRHAVEDLVLPARAGEILQSVWALEASSDVRSLTTLLLAPGHAPGRA